MSVYVDSDEEIEFDLPIEENDFSYTEVLLSDEEFQKVQSMVEPQDIVYNASNIPMALPSVPRCLSPPLKPLDTTKRGKQAYHDAVAAKTNTIPRIASPVGHENYTGMSSPSPPPPPSGMCSLTVTQAKLSWLQSSKIVQPQSSKTVQQTSEQSTSIPMSVRNVPKQILNRSRPVVFSKELMDKIPDVTNLIVATDQGYSITLPDTHSRALGNLITRKSFLPDGRKPLSFYNVLPNTVDLLWIHTTSGCSRKCYFMVIWAESVIVLVQDDFFVMRSNQDNFFLVFSRPDMNQLNKCV